MAAMPHQAGTAFGVVVPACDEDRHIGDCLGCLLAQEDSGRLEVVVSANACADATESVAAALIPVFAARGWRLDVLSSRRAGKTAALNRADAALTARGFGRGPRAYLDADVLCAPDLMGQLRRALSGPRVLYATGTLAIPHARSRATRAYARQWARTPFVRGGAVGAGLFALGAAGRARWGAFPDIISDDTFARLHFAPAERVEVPALYHWPMVEGLSNLVKVRRRQDAGVRQIASLWPELMENDEAGSLTGAALARAGLTDPLGAATYGLVHVATRMRDSGMQWTRGR